MYQSRRHTVMDFLARQESPLSASEWDSIDRTVVDVAKRLLVGRRFLNVFGPVGAGVQLVSFDTFGGTESAAIDMLGREPGIRVESIGRVHEELPLIYKDFVLNWRDIETARKFGTMLETGPAAAAAAFVAQAEDDVLFNGNPNLEMEGLMNARGKNTIGATDWASAGAAFDNVVAATQKLIEQGFLGPFAVVVNPMRYSQMHRIFNGSGVLEIEQVRALAVAGVFQSPAIRDYGFVFSIGPQNADVIIGQDLVTAYLGPENLNHPFRVMETLALRIKRPGAICTFETSRAGKK
jgi:uncharacterized linocin/CFP29 family protein